MISYKICYSIIFIEAPQLEVDENTGLTHHYEGSYDLVTGKPFMVRAGIHKLYQNKDLPANTRTMFNPVLKIEKEVNGEYKEIKVDYTCPGANNTESINDCIIEGKDFGGEFDTPQTEGDGTKYYGRIGKEFRIKKGLEAGTYRITVGLDFGSGVKVPCQRFIDETSNYFEVEVHEIKSPRIGLARANCEHIIRNCTVKDNVMNNFITKYDANTNPLGNKEIEWFERFFPVPENNQSNFKRTEYNPEIETIDIEINPELSISEQQQRRINASLALWAVNLSTHKSNFRYNYLVGIGSIPFFTDTEDGLGLKSTVAGIKFSKNPKSIFSKVVFIRSDKLNEGTLSHELGHLFGQTKEFYRKRRKGIFLDDTKQPQCTAHDLKIRSSDGSFNTTKQPCYKFRHYQYYDFKNSEYVAKTHSIMSNKSSTKEQKKAGIDGIDLRGMDRDTYITTFNSLIKPPFDPELTVFSGIYTDGKIYHSKITNRGNGILNSLSNEGDLHVMLKDSSNQILSEAKLPSSFEIELLDNEGGETITSDVIPIMISFPYQTTATKIVIMKEEKDGTETMIFSKDLPADNNPQHLFSSHNTHSTEKNFPMLEHTHKVELIKKKANKATSSSFTKFMYSPAFEMSFSYNACSDEPTSEDGIAILLGKDPADYTAEKLPNGNQGVKFNNRGLSLHLNMNKRIQLKDGGGQTLASTKYKVEMDCDKWKVLKLTIDENNRLSLTEKNKTLLSHDLTVSQINEIINQPIGFNAYSKEKGQYSVRNVTITALPIGEE